MTLEALEIEHIRSVLESTNWRVRGRGGAAERLGLKPTTLESRMAQARDYTQESLVAPGSVRGVCVLGAPLRPRRVFSL